MSTTTSPAEGQADAGADLTPRERLHEVASILATGVLRLMTTRPDGRSEKKAAQDQSSHSRQKPLDVIGQSSPDLSRG